MKDEISSSLNPGLHILVTIAEHVCDYVPKRVLKLLKYRLQIFLAKDHYLKSLQLYGDQFIPGQLKKTCSPTCSSDPYDLYGYQALKLLIFWG